MADRPILFSALMVRALLAGTKTQTRRVVKPQPPHDPLHDHVDRCGDVHTWWAGNHTLGKQYVARCPYGKPGDRLWVRESHWWFRDEHNPATGYFPPKVTADDVEYRADGEKPGRIWRPSIHMHRWAELWKLLGEKSRIVKPRRRLENAGFRW